MRSVASSYWAIPIPSNSMTRRNSSTRTPKSFLGWRLALTAWETRISASYRATTDCSEGARRTWTASLMHDWMPQTGNRVRSYDGIVRYINALEQLVRRDRQFAHSSARCVEDRISNRRGHAGDSDLADPTRPDLIVNIRIRLV